VTLDKDFESVAASGLGVGDKRYVVCVDQTANSGKCRFVVIDAIDEVSWHSLDRLSS
jgi:hypothetical protein